MQFKWEQLLRTHQCDLKTNLFNKVSQIKVWYLLRIKKSGGQRFIRNCDINLVFLTLGLWILIEHYLVIERDSIRYSYYLRRGDVCSSQDIHHSTLSPGGNTTTTTTPVSTTRTPGPELTLSPIRTLQTIGTRPPGGDKTTPSTDVISTQREVVQNGTEISGGRNGEKGSGGVSNIGR